MKNNQYFWIIVLWGIITIWHPLHIKAQNTDSNIKNKETFTCRIKGEVKTKKTCTKLLITDPLKSISRSIENSISIPVYNNKFDYTYYTSYHEIKVLVIYEEFMNGSFGMYPIFIEEGENEISISDSLEYISFKKCTPNNKEWDEIINSVYKLKLSANLDTVYKQLENMDDTEMFSLIGNALYKELDSLNIEGEKNGFTEEIAIQKNLIFNKINKMRQYRTLYSKVYYTLTNKIDSINQIINKQVIEKIAKQPSFAGLFYLYKLIHYNIQENSENILDYYKVYRKYFAKKWQNHPIGQKIETMIQSYMQIKIGQPYIVYSANDLQGNQVSINGLIKGKWAIIDLWASWCGPCRTKSKQLIPLYNQYKNQEFTIIGIARENKISDAENAIQKDGYPWIQLIDLQDKDSIWLRHGLENSAGGIFFINPQGRITAINPTIEEIESMLKQHLDKEK